MNNNITAPVTVPMPAAMAGLTGHFSSTRDILSELGRHLAAQRAGGPCSSRVFLRVPSSLRRVWAVPARSRCGLAALGPVLVPLRLGLVHELYQKRRKINQFDQICRRESNMRMLMMDVKEYDECGTIRL